MSQRSQVSHLDPASGEVRDASSSRWSALSAWARRPLEYRSAWGIALLHVQSGGWVGFLLGAVDALCSSVPMRALLLARVTVAGAAVGGTLGLLLGALLGVGHALLSASTRRRERDGMSSVDSAPLTPARVLSFLVAGALALAAFAYPLRVSERIMLSSLRLTVLALAATISIAVALVAAHRLEPGLKRWCERFASRSRLKSPSSPGLRFAAYAVVPTLAIGVPLVHLYGVHLGPLRWLILAAAFAVLERCAFLFLRPFLSALVLCVVSQHALLVSIVAGQLLLRPGARELRSIGVAHFLPNALGLVQRLTDVDRDGFSSLFGGRDCAPFDSSRFPGAREVPGNRVDEDCDGTDARAAASPVDVLPKFSARPPLGEKPFNVLWYIVDSLRPDHLKMHGYAFDTSPTLTALSADAWVFERAYSQSSSTAISMPSMFSGRNPAAMRWTRGTFPVASSKEFYLSRAFAARGAASGLAINSWVKQHLPGVQHGFQRVLVAPPEVNWKSGDYLLSNVFQLMDEARGAGKPFFVVAHVDDVHHPYGAAEGKAVPEFGSSGDKARYDAGIALFDQGLRVVIERLKYTGLWDRTVLIVTADHGEEFGEHGGAVHSRTCYEEVARVPLLIRIPRAGAQRIAHRVALVDLAPTLLELLDARLPGPFDGQSLLIPAYEPALVDPERPIFCAIYQVMDGRQPLFTRSVRRGRWSLFEEAKAGRVELYDRDQDPGEHVDLLASPGHAGVAAELRQVLSRMNEGNLFRVSEGLD